MATQSPPPDAPASEQAPPAAPAASDSASTAGVYEYVDLTPRTYLFPGAPQSAEFGDVCPLPYDPGDGNWRPSKKKVTRDPDNDPAQAAKNAQAQTKARADVLAKADEQAADAAGEA